MIFDNYDITVREGDTFDAHYNAYKPIYDSMFDSQWLQENKYGMGVNTNKIVVYNAWLIFRCIIQDDLVLYSYINNMIPESQIYTLNEYNELLNCFRCAAIELNNELDYTVPPMNVNDKPYYYGVSANGNLTANEIKSVLNEDSARSLGMKVSIGVGDPVYVYFVYPSSWGEVNEIKLSGFNQVSAYYTSFANIQYVTLAGLTDYTVVRSILTNDIDEVLNVQFKNDN